MISASRSGRKPLRGRCCRTYSGQSGMARPYDLVDGGHKFVPGAALVLQKLASRRRQAVQAPPPLARLFQPAAGNQAAILQAKQNGVERSDAKADLPLATLFNSLAEVVSVARTRLKKGENEEFGAAFGEIAIKHYSLWKYTSGTYMLASRLNGA